MALIADDPAHRVEQLILLSDRLADLIDAETARIEAREPTAPPELVQEKERLANAYRLELARIKDDRALVDTAPARLLARLRAGTERLQGVLARHDAALGAVKFLSEGLVQAIAEEIARNRISAQTYGADAAYSQSAGPAPLALDKRA